MKMFFAIWGIILLMSAAILTIARHNDSGWVVFESDRDGSRAIYLMTGGGQTILPVLNGASCAYGPRWSSHGSDGQWIAFTKCGDADGIYRVRANGSQLQVVDDDLLFPQVLDWSPGGQRLLVSSGGSRLYVMQADASDSYFLGEFITEGYWSPNDDWIYFREYHNPGLSLNRIHAETRLTEQLIPKHDALTRPSWSPDGAQMAIGMFADENYALYLLNADGSDMHKIPVDLPTPILRAQAWSPDGKWIAFAGGDHWLQDVFRVRPDGSDLQQLTYIRGEIASLQWSSDGQWLLIESDNDIFRLRVDDSSMQNLTPGSDDVQSPHPASVAGLKWHPLWLTLAAAGMLLAAFVIKFRP